MNLKQFAKAWIDEKGLADKDSDYNGMIGKSVMELVETFVKQGHSGFSAVITINAFHRMNKEYNEGTNKIWRAYWDSKEGQDLLKEHNLTTEDIIKSKEEENAAK